MELKEAIEILKAERERRLPLFMDVRVVYSAIDTVLAELEKQKQVKVEMLKAAWEKGYNQGYLAGTMEQI